MTSWRDRLFGPRWDGTAGRPRSGNGASSFHLFWNVPPGSWVRAEATLEILEPPRTDDLVFWALQVSFTQFGRRGGGAHLGLQWYDLHPGSTAVNWGGYGVDGRELDGSTSSLLSTPGNPNTRDFAWSPRRPYRLAIERVPGDADSPAGLAVWRGSVIDLTTSSTTVVRDLYAAGDHLDGPMVWSEVFADCSAPTSAVRWSDLRLVDESGATTVPPSVRINYQQLGDGGCATTDSHADEVGIVQRTGTTRRTDQGADVVPPSQSRS